MKKQNLVPTLSNNMSQQEKNVLKEIDRVNQKECDPIEKKTLSFVMMPYCIDWFYFYL